MKVQYIGFFGSPFKVIKIIHPMWKNFIEQISNIYQQIMKSYLNIWDFHSLKDHIWDLVEYNIEEGSASSFASETLL